MAAPRIMVLKNGFKKYKIDVILDLVLIIILGNFYKLLIYQNEY